MSTALESNKNSSITSTAAGDPQTALTADQVVQQLRALQGSIPEVAQLTQKERRVLRKSSKDNPEILSAQINVIGASDLVVSAVGQSLEGARQMVEDDDRWTAVERELKALLNGVVGGNVLRRQKIRALGAQAYAVGTSLAKTPLHAELVPHVAEVRRLKRLARRKKAEPQQQPPVDQHASGT